MLQNYPGTSDNEYPHSIGFPFSFFFGHIHCETATPSCALTVTAICRKNYSNKSRQITEKKAFGTRVDNKQRKKPTSTQLRLEGRVTMWILFQHNQSHPCAD